MANKPVITVSSHHVASMVDMVTRGEADINVVLGGNGCPHHHHFKPSDMQKIRASSLVVYIDEKFETGFSSLATSGNILILSSINGVNITNNNMHIWLSLENMEAILNAVYNKLVELAPMQQKLWWKNLAKSKLELRALTAHKNKVFEMIKPPLLLDNSLEYLFDKTSAKLYLSSNMMSLKTIHKLDSLGSGKCLIASSSENVDNLAGKAGMTIIYVDSEKWTSESGGFDNYINHYRNIIDNIGAKCSK